MFFIKIPNFFLKTFGVHFENCSTWYNDAMRLGEYANVCPTYTRKHNSDIRPEPNVDPDVYPFAEKPAGKLRVDLMKLNKIVKRLGDTPGVLSQEAFDQATRLRTEILHEL